MSTEQSWQTSTENLQATLALAAQIGQRLKGGETIELRSDLGGGKTTFVKGLALGLGSQDGVRSPSFTIGNQYQAGDLTLYHFDFYRLHDAGILRDELADIASDLQAITVIEWGDIVEDVLPTERLIITIINSGETSRQFTFDYPEMLAYLVPKDNEAC